MKFFKYLIFIFLSLISIQTFSAVYYFPVNNSNLRLSSPEDACQYIGSTPFKADTNPSGDRVGTCSNGMPVHKVTQKETSCPSTVTSTPISVPGWTSWNIDQIDSYSAQISGKTACYQGCKYKNPTMTGSEGSDSMSLLYGDPVKDSSCPVGDTTRPSTPTPNNTGSTQMKPEECKSPTGSDGYCNKPSNKQCPAGYKQGSFNNQQICIKPSPDPDPSKPNPNDPNNGKGEGSCNGTNNCNTTNLDDTNIVNAINSSKNAITQAISSLSETITSSFTTVTNAINGTTNAVNNNTNAVNAVKSSVDALHNTINAVTTAVNNNTSAVTSAVNANTSATNAVKASVDALNSTVSAVTSAVDNNTKAVNANGDKVANAVKDNITATNAVKTAVDNLNSAVNAVSDAVNANGKNTVDAVNANGDKVTNAVNTNGKNTVDAVNKGTEATKENGKKLDGIKDGVDKGNGILGEIKDWLFADIDQSSFEAKTPMRDLEQKDIESDKYKVSGQCPVSKTFSFKGHTFTLDLSNFCYVLDIMGIIIGIAACLHGVAILSENT